MAVRWAVRMELLTLGDLSPDVQTADVDTRNEANAWVIEKLAQSLTVGSLDNVSVEITRNETP